MANSFLSRLFKRANNASTSRSRQIVIPDHLWQELPQRLPCMSWLNGEERERLRTLSGQLLARKAINGAADLELTDQAKVSIAAQACLLILHLDMQFYDGWEEIIVYPGEFLVPRQEFDEAGVMHEFNDVIAGEAWDGGPVVISWNDSDISALNPAFNIVLHEFAHKLDLYNGEADGIPVFSKSLHPHLTDTLWKDGLETAYQDFVHQVETIEAEIPPELPKDSEQTDAYYEKLAFDSYAAENIAEFFAICTESFFMTPTRLHRYYPSVYWLLTQYYRQDPMARLFK